MSAHWPVNRPLDDQKEFSLEWPLTSMTCRQPARPEATSGTYPQILELLELATNTSATGGTAMAHR